MLKNSLAGGKFEFRQVEYLIFLARTVYIYLIKSIRSKSTSPRKNIKYVFGPDVIWGIIIYIAGVWHLWAFLCLTVHADNGNQQLRLNPQCIYITFDCLRLNTLFNCFSIVENLRCVTKPSVQYVILNTHSLRFLVYTCT